MLTRRSTVAGTFYPAGRDACQRQIEQCLRDASQDANARPVQAGVVPHAGWTFSGAVAAKTYATIAASGLVDTVVFFGAVHSWGVAQPSMYGRGQWATPLGPAAIDEALARAVLESAAGRVVDRPEAHASEHSVEVQVPFVKHLFPDAMILPMAVPPHADAEGIGRLVARAAESAGKRVVAVGSSDLTHYGPRYGYDPVGVGQEALRWAMSNDRRLLDLALAMDADGVQADAQQHRSACGAGAIAAAIGYASECGATEGILLQHTNSHLVMPMGEPADMVGYGAIAYV